MELTTEQINAVFDGATKESAQRKKALHDALDAMRPACEACWFRLHGDGCEQKRCSIWRMNQTLQQVLRMRRNGKLDAWEWYVEAKNNDRILFATDTEATKGE